MLIHYSLFYVIIFLIRNLSLKTAFIVECTMSYIIISLKKYFFLQILKEHIKFGGKPVNLIFLYTFYQFHRCPKLQKWKSSFLNKNLLLMIFFNFWWFFSWEKQPKKILVEFHQYLRRFFKKVILTHVTAKIYLLLFG